MFDERSHPPAHSTFNLHDVRNRPVIDDHGDNVGRVVDVVVDATGWKVSHFLVSLDRALAPQVSGRSPGLFAGNDHLFEVEARRIRSVGDNVILDVDLHSILDRLRTHDEAEERRSYADQAEADRLRFGRAEIVGRNFYDPPLGGDERPPMP
jgi:sporulation protein YlmC with PRC-barrel domain